jgi:hypothetical protein
LNPKKASPKSLAPKKDVVKMYFMRPLDNGVPKGADPPLKQGSKGEAMPQTTKIPIDGKSIVASVDEFFGANCLRVTVGTNCPQGGDSGHGGRTVLILEDQRQYGPPLLRRFCVSFVHEED